MPVTKATHGKALTVKLARDSRLTVVRIMYINHDETIFISAVMIFFSVTRNFNKARAFIDAIFDIYPPFERKVVSACVSS